VPQTSPALLLAGLTARDPGRPLVTFYDDATGERTELSVVTFENWVAKTANLMVDGLGLGPGARVTMLLPLHWQSAVWLAACWSVGAEVTVDAGDSGADDADLAVCWSETLDDALAADEVVALSLLPWGRPFPEPPPPGVLDYAGEVASYGDRFTPSGAPSTTVVGAERFDDAALLAAAADAAQRWGLATGGRLLTSADPATRDGLLALLPAALVQDASVVLVRNPVGHSENDEVHARRVDAEKITASTDGPVSA
jgi:uncharacterized protein (TIGR03089 family)